MVCLFSETTIHCHFYPLLYSWFTFTVLHVLDMKKDNFVRSHNTLKIRLDCGMLLGHPEKEK